MRIFRTNQFKRDYRRVARQSKDLEELREVVGALSKDKKLKPKHQDHPLFGHWKKHRECHIKGDWLLIYRVDKNALLLERTGSHSELFR